MKVVEAKDPVATRFYKLEDGTLYFIIRANTRYSFFKAHEDGSLVLIHPETDEFAELQGAVVDFEQANDLQVLTA